MDKYINTNIAKLLLLAVSIGFIVEIIMFVNPFLILFVVATIYFGVKLRPHFLGTIILIIGILTALGILLKLKVLKFVFIIIILIFLYYYYYKNNNNRTINVETTINDTGSKKSQANPLLQNIFIGNKKLGDQVFELDDINIQTGIGNIVIDLSMTMIPPGETVIVIRGLIGNIQVLVPYDVATTVNHSVLIGKLNTFSEVEEGFNKNVTYVQKGYGTATRKVKIVTSTIIGDLEVKNI